MPEWKITQYNIRVKQGKDTEPPTEAVKSFADELNGSDDVMDVEARECSPFVFMDG